MSLELGRLSDRKPPFKYSALDRVGFSDTDAQGIVYYGRYMPYFDLARVEYHRHLGMAYSGPREREFVMRACTIDYLAPARFDDLDRGLRPRLAHRANERDLRMRRLPRGGRRAHGHGAPDARARRARDAHGVARARVVPRDDPRLRGRRPRGVSPSFGRKVPANRRSLAAIPRRGYRRPRRLDPPFEGFVSPGVADVHVGQIAKRRVARRTARAPRGPRSGTRVSSASPCAPTKLVDATRSTYSARVRALASTRHVLSSSGPSTARQCSSPARKLAAVRSEQLVHAIVLRVVEGPGRSRAARGRRRAAARAGSPAPPRRAEPVERLRAGDGVDARSPERDRLGRAGERLDTRHRALELGAHGVDRLDGDDARAERGRAAA